MRTPRLYLAGKIGKNDWRRLLVSNLRGHLWSDGPIHNEKFAYVGPFFVANSHDCYHGPNRHGAVGTDYSFDQNYDQPTVIQNNNASLASADLVFAYITATDCYGTLIEIGWALGKGIRVVIAFAPNVPSDDFWYGAQQASSTHFHVWPCCLPVLLADELQKTKPRA